jgi:hypothetical protein
MKHAMPIAGAVLALGAAIATGMLSRPGTAAPASTAGFARPDFTPVRPAPEVDLTLFSNRADPDALKKLASEPAVCHEALDAAGVGFTVIEAKHTEQGCGYEEALTVRASLSDWQGREPLVMTCAMAARLHMWERHVVAPAAIEHFGTELAGIEALGAFSCRNVAGSHKLSKHAFGEAADIAGFRLADGRVITVLNDYHSPGPEGEFLRQIRKEACSMFDVTLGPNYNADHQDHFHLDVGGDKACK